MRIRRALWLRDASSHPSSRGAGVGHTVRADVLHWVLPVRSVAFLRGINVGGRRVTKDELIRVFTARGFTSVSTFLASGNVLFDHAEPADGELIGVALDDALGYPVPTTVRSADAVRSIADRNPFSTEEISAANGKPQVILLFSHPTEAQQKMVLDIAHPADRLVFEGQELHWLPPGGISDSALNLNAISTEVGPITVRTANTMVRLLPRL